VDFVVNSNRTINSDSTGLFATITALPEPASMTVLGLEHFQRACIV